MNGDLEANPAQPLSGRRIVITRARAQSAGLASQIEKLGGLVFELPTIEIQAPADVRPLDEAIARLTAYDWLIFTSVNGVESFLSRMAHQQRGITELKNIRCVAIGPETAKRLISAGVKECLVPAIYQAEGILELFQPEALRGKHVLIPRAAKAREILPETLKQWGAAVDVVEAYQTTVPSTDTGKLRELFRQGAVDMVTFTSSSTATNFAQLFGGEPLSVILAETPIACIGPITRETVEALGGTAAVLARDFTVAGLVAAMVDYFRTSSPPF
jgi:uroporphyrinogen III methyltransferase/synthase